MFDVVSKNLYYIISYFGELVKPQCAAIHQYYKKAAKFRAYRARSKRMVCKTPANGLTPPRRTKVTISTCRPPPLFL